MVYRRNGLYRSLFFICLLVAIVLMIVSATLPDAVNAATFITGLFVLIIALSYFNLSNEENKMP